MPGCSAEPANARPTRDFIHLVGARLAPHVFLTGSLVCVPNSVTQGGATNRSSDTACRLPPDLVLTWSSTVLCLSFPDLVLACFSTGTLPDLVWPFAVRCHNPHFRVFRRCCAPSSTARFCVLGYLSRFSRSQTVCFPIRSICRSRLFYAINVPFANRVLRKKGKLMEENRDVMPEMERNTKPNNKRCISSKRF